MDSIEAPTTGYKFHTKPFAHQAEVFKLTREASSFALFWEQGCGKTKPVIDTAASLFLDGKIDALVVVAPSGVERNWITDEIPTHMPPDVRANARMEFWSTKRAGNKAHAKAMDALLAHSGLVVLAISYDAFMTKRALEYLRVFFRRRNMLLAIDEAHHVKTPAAKRTKTLTKASKFAAYRRIMTGTPISKPFDVYSQVNIVDDGFWRRKGITNFTAFKQYFGVWRTCHLNGGKSFQQLVNYKNLNELQAWLAEVGHRLTKADALDLPPKVYLKRYFTMSDRQADAYESMRREALVELENDQVVSAELAIVKLLRLQQIVCGYLPTSDGKFVRIDDTNPRLDAFEDIAAGLNRPGIVWARFTPDINQVCERLSDMGKTFVRYDGSVDPDARQRGKEAFNAGDIEWFVGNPQAGATGLTLLPAKHVVYYSNSFKLIDRLQSEDRNHRIGQTDSIDYTDLMAAETVDEKIVEALRTGFDIAGQLLGDKLREWI